MSLDRANYKKGFLVDDAWMGGVSDDPETPGRFIAFVIDHSTGAYIACTSYANEDEALAAINAIPRGWKFEGTSGCDGSKCGEGKCKKEGCRIYTGPSSASESEGCKSC